MTGYTEDSLVQETAASYLEQELGWESMHAQYDEGFGPDSLLGRDSEREVVLTRYLRKKLIELNPNLPEEVYEDAIKQVATVVASQSLVATNREKYELIREGIQVTYRNADGEKTRDRLRIIDFDNPSNNHFLCVREMWVKGNLYRRRPDIMGFVNGLPLLFIECKNIHRNLRVAFEENFSDYKDTIPHIFHHNAIVMFANGEKAKIGSITSKWGHFHSWKRLEEEAVGRVDMETALKGICNKDNFIDFIENFIVFDDSAAGTKKIIARNHQFLGVNKAIDSVRNRESNEGKLGVFWHTQGSGKSYSMVMFTRKVHRKIGGDFTFVVLTDREDLDSQIYKTFAGCDVVNNDTDPCRASSGDHLRQLLGEHKTHVFSLIQKFNKIVDEDDCYTKRDNVVVITDEAHRTQYGTLALNMRNALPNASFIGFTGTPLFKDDEITSKVFGEYVSTYGFSRAVEDGATVPLYYDARGSKLALDITDLNEKIADKLEEYEAENIDVQEKLERELARDYHIVTAPDRLEQIAKDFVQHYSTGWENGKAMFVCIDKITCVRMYDLIIKYWEERITALEQEAQRVTDEQEEIYILRQIEWMKETRTAVVVSEEQGEVDKFRKWDLDIEVHRKLIKEGIDLPESMRNRPEYRNMQRMELDDAFKVAEHPFRIAIVCAMWLTGFDVPSLSTLYIDKPLKAHTLMQAIARANRVHEGKNNGLIVDYAGILKQLRSALAVFAGSRPDGSAEDVDPTKPKEVLLGELAESIELVVSFLNEEGASITQVINSDGFDRISAIVTCKEAVNENDETRKRFEVMCREVFKKFKSCITIDGVNAHRENRDAINAVYKSLQQDREEADISDIIKELHEIIGSVIATKPTGGSMDNETYDISKIDFERLKAEFERIKNPRTTVQNLKEAVETRLQRLMRQNPTRTDFQERYEKMIAEYNQEKDRAIIEKTFEALLVFIQELDEEENRAIQEGLDEETQAIFDLLKKPSLDKKEAESVKKVAINLLATLKEEKLKIDQWRDKEATRDAVKIAVYDFLWNDKTGLTMSSYETDDIKELSVQVFRHLYYAYPELPSPIYSEVA